MVGACLRILQGPLNRRNQVGKLAFQNVIRRAHSQGFDSHSLTHGSGYKDKRNIGTLLLSQGESLKTVERRQSMVREDHVRASMLKLVQKFRFRIRACRFE